MIPPVAARPPTTEQTLVLTLRADGATLHDIANELRLRPSAVARLLRGGMVALGVRTQVELLEALGLVRQTVDVPEALTSAEREVVLLVLEGSSNGEIAAARGTSTRTVANQLQAIYGKLSVGSRRELVAHLLGRPLRHAR